MIETGIAENIRRIRKERGLTQEELAERVGTSRSHIAQIEWGGKCPTVILAADIAKELGVGLEELAGDIVLRE